MKQSTLQSLNTAIATLQELAGTIRKETGDAIGTGDHVEIIRHFNDVRIANEMVKEGRDALNAIADNLSKEVIPEVMKQHGIKTTTIEGVGRVTVSYRFSCSMTDKEAGISWLKDEGHGDIVQETVNSSTLGGFARNMLEVEGKELPEDIFKISMSPYTSITKVK